MSAFIYIFFALALYGAYISKKQEQKHFIERSIFFSNEELQRLHEKPKKDLIESSLILFVGIFVAQGFALFLRVFFISINDEHLKEINEIHDFSMLPLLLLSFGLSLGLIVFGIKSIYVNYKFLKKKIKTTNPNHH